MLQGRIESDEKIKKHILEKLDSQPLYVTEWFENLQARGVTMKSCADYINKISLFLNYIRRKRDFYNGIDLNEITLSDVQEYFIDLNYKTNKDGSKARTSDSYRISVWTALNTFFEYNIAAGNCEKNHLSQIEIKKHSKKAKKPMLKATDFKKMLCNVPGYGYTRIRNKAILLLYMTTGMRRDALCQIDVDDIDFEKGTLIVIDKGEKEHEYQLNKQTLSAIKDWLPYRSIHYSSDSNALFLSNQGLRISGSSVVDIVGQASQKALGYRISPHKLRAGLCSILYEQKHDIEFVRRSIGHSDASTTQRYIITEGNERKEASDIIGNLLS